LETLFGVSLIRGNLWKHPETVGKRFRKHLGVSAGSGLLSSCVPTASSGCYPPLGWGVTPPFCAPSPYICYG